MSLVEFIIEIARKGRTTARLRLYWQSLLRAPRHVR